MSVVLAEVTRGALVESKHRGSIVVTNASGDIIASAGDPYYVTYMRSAAKPIQAMNVILSGAADKFALNDQELAMMCASHQGEEMHKKVIYGFLKKIGLSLDDLVCGSPLSSSPEYREKQLREHLPIDAANSDCSGKHCGFLAVCQTKGYPTKGYQFPEHVMQQEVLAILAEMSDMKPEDIVIGVDGCTVPVHAFPLANMATAYARFANPENLKPAYQDACERLFQAMNNAPEMITGTNGFCSEFLRHTHRKFCGKYGAEAVYCIGVKDQDLGIAIKIEDGNLRALYPVVISTLKQLNLLTDEELEQLDSFANPIVRNNRGEKVGEIVPNFTLEFK